uniref:S8 family serine peptidase n=1 Tax=Bordetella sputigena TaxID=1416810 RepID=UPI0039F064B5
MVVGVHEQSRIDVDHEDLAPNLLVREPLGPAALNDHDVAHATATASIIAAVQNNGKGGGSIAPEAKVLDMLAPGARSFPVPPIRNISGGASSFIFEPYSTTEYPDMEIAEGKGSLVIKAGGNEFFKPYKVGISEEMCREETSGTGVSCLTTTAERLNSMAQTVTVAAVNAQGVKSSYSNTGSALWVSGLGGEFGQERKYTVESGESVESSRLAESGAHGTKSRIADDHLYAPALVAADTMGVASGLNRDAPGNPRFNALDSGSMSSIDPSGNYTARANGTSAATPTVTGVAALLLQANPELGWRDIKYILATTARKVDADRPRLAWQGLVLDDGWVTNAAGRSFSTWYGFGLVDATAAVRAAQRHVPLGPLRNTGWLATTESNVPIVAKSAPASGSHITVDQDIKIETVQLRLRTNHENPPGQLHIVLTSPSGTRSIILPAHTLLALMPGQDTFSIDLAASNAFLDESARGTWTLQVVDAKDPAPSSSILSWELRVLGH